MIKLEVGKFYRTRDGRKVGPMREDANPMYFCTTVEGRSRSYRPDGTRQPESGYPELTIVAEWTEDAPESLDTARREAAEEETELERLVRVANEGYAARDEVYRRYGQQYVTYINGDGPEHFISGTLRFWEGSRFAVKPRPAFEPFYVGPPALGSSAPDMRVEGAWRVSLSDDGKTLSVGCQTFDAKLVLPALKALTTGQYGSFSVGSVVLHAHRNGIGRDSARTGGELSWSDADRILAALEKALGQKEAV
jgi:hypothetical protein